jgi:hypothetical protein
LGNKVKDQSFSKNKASQKKDNKDKVMNEANDIVLIAWRLCYDYLIRHMPATIARHRLSPPGEIHVSATGACRIRSDPINNQGIFG